jgi:putative nucleotidyltransferase with HDIG domain
LADDGRSNLEVGLRSLIFFLGCGLAGGTSYYLGLGIVHALVVGGLTAVLAAVATELPWGGLFFPCDALVLSMCLVTARLEIAVVGLGAALASAVMVSNWQRRAGIACLRAVAASIATVVVWRNLVGSEVLATFGGSPLMTGAHSDWIFTARAILPLAAATLTFFAAGSVVELSLRTRRGFSLREFLALNFGKHMHYMAFTLVIGVIASVAYLDMGLLAFVLFGFPLMLTRDALRRNLALRRSRIEALRALSSSVDARDSYTFDHSSRVSKLAALLAREMGFPESTIEMIESGALLHDIGKISLDAEILSKPGPLDADERLQVRQHPMQSAHVVSRVELFKGAVDIVRHHHERPDGQGYPDGLRADEIPMGARILNVADAFDAMTSDRPYRTKRSISEALEELKKGSGREFDPVVVEYLMRLLRKRADEIASLGIH